MICWVMENASDFIIRWRERLLFKCNSIYWTSGIFSHENLTGDSSFDEKLKALQPEIALWDKRGVIKCEIGPNKKEIRSRDLHSGFLWLFSGRNGFPISGAITDNYLWKPIKRTYILAASWSS